MPAVCHAVSVVVVMLQYSRNAEKERKIVKGIEI
jgi:hypothetical protein